MSSEAIRFPLTTFLFHPLELKTLKTNLPYNLVSLYIINKTVTSYVVAFSIISYIN